MAYTYTTVNGQRVQTDVAAAFQRMRTAFRARFGLDLIVSSGTRTRAEQQHLYNLYRAGKGGLAAAPGFSNHEETGPRGPRAIDIRDSGTNAGVTQAGNARSNWIKANAPTYGFDPAGYRFSQVEPWHIEYTGPLGGGFAGGGGSFISFGNLSTEYIRALQSQLGVGVDGQVGAGTISALQKKIGAAVDGQVGPDTTRKLQAFVGAGVDGIWGTDTTNKLKFAIDGGWFGQPLHVLIGAAHTRKLQEQLGVTADGLAGSGTISKLQQKIGAGADGVFGRGTISKLQSFVGAGVDGIWGADTATKVRAAIDASKFGTVVPPKPPVTKPTRKAADNPVNRRKNPTDAEPALMPQIDPGTTVDVKSFAKGKTVGGNNIWFRLADDTWAWSGGFTDKSATGLTEEVIDVPTQPTVIVPEDAVFGIDVAYPQTGEFDWAKVKEHYNFVIIKAAGGEDGIYGPAALLDKHLAGARSVNLAVGFYFFNNNRHSVKAQADKFIEVLTPRIRPGDVIALDIEDVGNQPVQFNPAQALEFAQYMEEALDIKTFMYLNRSSVNNADWSAVVEDGHPLWLATLDGLEDGVKYLQEGSVKWWGSASLVQFSSSTPIPGYPHGPVDQNICMVSDLAEVEFVAFPTVDEPEEPEEPDEDETPGWFRRFLEGLMEFFRKFLGS